MYNVLDNASLTTAPTYCDSLEDAQTAARQIGPSAQIIDLRPQYARNLIEGIMSGELVADTAEKRDLKSRLKMFGAPKQAHKVKDWAQRLGHENQTELGLLLNIFAAWSL